ncbi:hypothetical protein HPP92_005882 [Vanilla planifolia]|uniref:Pentatricopeptide repeat-containing protein n=1 Tax=Vanilla planifolia TaxID=51239 RepID=A0A835RJC0_VANPL|nr:hypothetical protein HPP92_005882 [Vanilla planifolia]
MMNPMSKLAARTTMLKKPTFKSLSQRFHYYVPLQFAVSDCFSSTCQLQRLPETRKPGNSRAFFNSQITQRGRQGNLDEARRIFDNMPFRDVISWTAMLTAYADNGDIRKAREVFEQMPKRNAASWNAMISAYARNPNLLYEAYAVFAAMPCKNSVSYGAIITGFARGGMLLQAEEIYLRMPANWRDPIGSNALISAYLRSGEIEKADRVFRGMVYRDVFTWSLMVDGYCKCGRILEARGTFEAMPVKNVVSWTSIIRGYLDIGNLKEGFGLFSLMRMENVSANSTTLSVLLDACSVFGGIREGTQVHGMVIAIGFEQDTFLGNTMIAMYSRIDCIDAARRIFDAMSKKNVVSWNSIITAYVEQDNTEEAYAFFAVMPEKDVVSWTSMVVGFCKRGLTEESISLFELTPEKDEIGWTAIVSGLVRNGENEIACQWFGKMMREGIKPNPVVLSSILSSMAGLAVLKNATPYHVYVVKLGLDSDIFILSSLISMYSKCGNLSQAYQIFSTITASNLVCINSMISAYAQHGLAWEALDLFKWMLEGGYKPNEVTFLGVLTACSRAGLVQEGNHYFKCMRPVFGIDPGPDHYACMVDMLGRAGLLHEALELVNSIPNGPQSSAWGAMLGASGAHSNLDLAQLAAQQLFELEPNKSAPYAVLSKLYATAGLKEDEESVRMRMHSKGVMKNPGCSWITRDGNALSAHA